jgi:hypothetical protein
VSATEDGLQHADKSGHRNAACCTITSVADRPDEVTGIG